MIKENNYTFIDGNNLILGLKSQGWKIDYRQFFIFLRDKYRVTKAFWFIGYIPGNENIYENIQKAGFKIIFKETLIDSEGKTKGNVDVLLTVTCLQIQKEYTGMILVSGDGDFVDLIKAVQENGKNIKIFIPDEKKASRLFKPFEKDCRYLSEYSLRKKLEYKKNG